MAATFNNNQVEAANAPSLATAATELMTSEGVVVAASWEFGYFTLLGLILIASSRLCWQFRHA
jgi:hypothetical protein